MNLVGNMAVGLSLLILAACATGTSRAPAGPLEYQQGYAEGCDSGYVAAGHPYYRFTKDPVRYGSDSLYAQGWNDGFMVCKGGYESTQRMLGPVF